MINEILNLATVGAAVTLIILIILALIYIISLAPLVWFGVIEREHIDGLPMLSLFIWVSAILIFGSLAFFTIIGWIAHSLGFPLPP